jgi:hypothetical protein
MNEYNFTVSLTKEEYSELIAKAERIAAVQRLVDSGVYVSTDDIYAVLGIKIPAKTKAEVIE